MDLELKSLRIFLQVMKEQTFSGAARVLKLTQPTISQQIAKLESEMETRLFERVGHKIIPTASALELRAFAETMIDQYDEFNSAYKDQRSAPKGLVRYAMPESCQWTPHFKQIMALLPQSPEIQFQIKILPNEEIADLLLSGHLDFAFLTGEKLAPDLRFEKFSDERYSAVATSKEALKPLLKGSSEPLRLVTFPGWESLFSTWAKTHGLWTHLRSQLREPAVQIGSLAGAIHAVKAGAGIAVLPTHCLFEELKEKKLVELSPKKGEVASCPIYLAKKVGTPLPKRVEHVITQLREAKRVLG